MQGEKEGLTRDHFLGAPCEFCGYNGPNYWQSGTHAKYCPWYSIGGQDERFKAVPEVVGGGIRQMQIRIEELERSNAALIEALREFVRIDDEDTHGLMAGSGSDVVLALESARRLLSPTEGKPPSKEDKP